MRLNNVIVITLTLLSAPVMGAGDMFLDLNQDSHVSSLNDRHYSAVLGRFLTPDVAKISISEYTYNNVILSSDPSGLGLWSKINRFFGRSIIEESDFPPSFERQVASNDEASKVKYTKKSSRGKKLKGASGSNNLSIIPDTSMGASATDASIGKFDMDQFKKGDSSDDNLYTIRQRTHQDKTTDHPEYRPTSMDREVTKVKGHHANISSDDDFGPAISTISNRIHNSSRVSYRPSGGNVEINPGNYSEFNQDLGVSGSLTKTKKIVIGGAIIALATGTAALIAYFVLKNKDRSIAPGPSPAPPGPTPTPCPGMTPHPPPC